MIVDFTKKHVAIVLVCFLLCGGLGVAVYYYLLQPEKNRLQQIEMEYETAQQELTNVENRLNQMKEQTILSSMELQKQLPVKPLVERLLLEIEKAELLSDCKVLQVSIDQVGEQVIEETTANDEIETGDDDETETDGDQSTSNEEEQFSEEESKPFVPRGMNIINVNVDAEATSYFEIEKFIEVIQSLQRVVRIDSLQFTGKEEMTTVDDEVEEIPFNLTITAFYYPELTDLYDELPKINRPDPANKKDPLYRFPTQIKVDE